MGIIEILVTLSVAFHSFNRFLGTFVGEFFKESIEFVVLVIVTYMIWSEYKREKLPDLKYLSVAFTVLLIGSAITLALLGLVNFGGLDRILLAGETSILLSSLELLALLLIANAFTFQKRKKAVFFDRMRTEVFALLYIFLALIAVWYSNVFVFQSNGLTLIIFVFIELLKVAVLGFATFLILFKMGKSSFKITVAVALALFMLAPILTLVRLTVWQTQILKVISNPFPIISVLLFTRAIYLKLVDKQNLKAQVARNRLKYRQEREVSKLKDEFISTVSHELKTPLTSMRLYLSLLLQGKQGNLNPSQRKTIEIIKGESVRLTELISDLLHLSKLENRKVAMKMSNVSLHDLVESTIHKNIAERKGIEVHNRVDKDLNVSVDVNRFKQVIINLYSNAVKYTDKNGAIWLDGKRGRDHWTFSVTDNGCGIAWDKLKQIFSKFYQVENYLTRRKGGTGLGLAIAKHVIDLHDGRIKVRSDVGKGSTFTVMIPKKQG